MEGLNAFERASLYVSLHTYMSWAASGKEQAPAEVVAFFENLGVNLPTSTSEISAHYLKSFRAGVHRQDINPTARANLQNHLTAFYTSSGYVSSEPSDSISSMTAFAARLAIDAYLSTVRNDDVSAERLERQLHRFLKTHLIPALEHLKPPGEDLAEAVEKLAQLVKEDASALAMQLSRQKLR